MNKEYKKKEDIPVGKIMVRKNGKKYVVVAMPGCKQCSFYYKPKEWCDLMLCCKNTRNDNTDVIFMRRRVLEEKKEIGI